jgi:hypothetical protein
MDFDDDDNGDAFDEINNAGDRQTTDEEFAAAGGSPRPRLIGAGDGGSHVNGPGIKRMADERWDDHLDDPNVARDVLRRAKTGDEDARRQFYLAHHKLILKLAADPKYGGPPFEDKLSAAEVGFWKAFKGFNLNRNSLLRLRCKIH